MTRNQIFNPPLYAILLAWLCSAGVALAETEQLTPAGEAFVIAAQQSTKGEVALGQMAAEKAQNAEVRDFGMRLVKDHSKANKELLEFASRRDIALENDLSAEHRQLSDKLSGLSGDAFDKEFISAMIEDHQKDMEKFKTAANTLSDSFIVTFAKQTLPTLSEHLRIAETLEKQLQPTEQQRQ